jgi:hypothetical protein
MCAQTMARLACLWLLLILSAMAASAATLTDYRQRVHQAVVKLDSLSQWAEEETTAETHAARVSAVLNEVRRSLPSEESVEWQGRGVHVDNGWLHEELKTFERMSASDPKRAETLAHIVERLSALDEKLEETDGKKLSEEGAQKDEEKARLAAILRREEYSKKSKEESAISRLIRRILNWLRDLFPDAAPIAPGPSSAASRLVQIIVYAVCLLIIAFLAWKFGPRLLRRLLSQKKKEQKREARIVLGERLEADQNSADLLMEAEKLARSGDLRGAIRKGYIALLCELGDRKLLRLAQHKTNRDYLRDVKDKELLGREMQRLTNSFESHWYGFVPATPEDWDSFRAGYNQALNST